VDISAMSPVDFAWLFSHIRMKSKGETIDLTFRCNERREKDGETYKCNSTNDVRVDLTQMVVVHPDGEVDPVVKVDDKISMKLRHLTLGEGMELRDADPFAVFNKVIESVITGDNVFFTADASEEAVNTFIESLPRQAMEAIDSFIKSAPVINLPVEFDCDACGHHHSEVLTDVNDFLG